jgi:hypothetical protein
MMSVCAWLRSPPETSVRAIFSVRSFHERRRRRWFAVELVFRAAVAQIGDGPEPSNSVLVTLER